MSIFCTIELTPSEAIQLIAEHLCDYAEDPQYMERDRNDNNILLARILFTITSNNSYSPYHKNNYTVTESPSIKRGLEAFKEENHI